MTVDLPAPVWPISAVSEPGSTVSDTSLSAQGASAGSVPFPRLRAKNRRLRRSGLGAA